MTLMSFPPLFRQRRWLLAALVTCALPGVVSAHHSFAIFDQTKTVTIKGVVSRFAWTNPHVAIYVDALSLIHISEPTRPY